MQNAFCQLFPSGRVAQLVEQRTENPRVASSILALATIPFHSLLFPSVPTKLFYSILYA